jgi:uncharacterized surface protein with fasciclin (FAS1) repeats
MAGPDALFTFLSHHVTDQRMQAAEAHLISPVLTLGESDLQTPWQDGALRVNVTPVTLADVEAPNGVIHLIDRMVGLEP